MQRACCHKSWNHARRNRARWILARWSLAQQTAFKVFVVVSFALLLVAFSSCSQGVDNAGGGIETETLTARVYDGEQQAFSGARVSLYAADQVSPKEEAQAFSDEKGLVSFEVPAGRSWTLVASDTSTSAQGGDTLKVLFSGVASGVSTTTPDIQLELNSTVQTTLTILDQDSIPLSATMRLWGIPGQWTANVKGQIVLQDLPEGLLWIQLEVDAQTAANRGLGDGSHSVVMDYPLLLDPAEQRVDVVFEPRVLLLEDFSRSVFRTLPGAVLGDGYWWQVDDREKDGDSYVLPTDIGSRNSSAVDSAWGFMGQGMRAEFFVEPLGWAVVGFNWSHAGTDLRLMDSLTFYARGQGEFTVEFVSGEHRDSLQDLIHLGQKVAISSEWKQYAVVPDSLDYSEVGVEDSAKHWEAQGRKVFFTQFVANDSAFLEIDQLQIHGVNLEDILLSSGYEQ